VQGRQRVGHLAAKRPWVNGTACSWTATRPRREDDIACARAAFAALNVEVRCAPGSWVEEEGEETADRWMRISADGEEEITWKTV